MCPGSSSNSMQHSSESSSGAQLVIAAVLPNFEGLSAGWTWVGTLAGSQVQNKPSVSDCASELLRGTWRPGVGASSLWVLEG